MDIKDEIIKTIELLIDKKIKTSPSDVPAVVLGISRNKYKVSVNGIEYLVNDGVRLQPSIGTSVWLHCPNGNISKAYIAALR